MKIKFHGFGTIGILFAIRLLFFLRGRLAFARLDSRLRSLVRLPSKDIAALITSSSDIVSTLIANC